MCTAPGIFTPALQSWCFYPHLTSEKSKAQKGEVAGGAGTQTQAP